MFDAARRLIGSISVTEENGIINISGLPADFITADMDKQWGTSRISSNMFIKMSKSRLSFYSFFAPDFVYTLKALCSNKKAKVNRRAAAKVIEEMYLNTWLANTLVEPNSKFNYDNLKYINVPLKEHQHEFLHTFDIKTQQYGLNGYLLGAAPGSGKTLIGLALNLVDECDVTIMIVPKNSVERVWDATIDTMLTSKRRWWTSAGTAPLEAGYTHYVFHYEQLGRAIEFFSKYKSFKKPGIILDECHNFNEVRSQRTIDFVELCKLLNSKTIVLASGTPVKAMGTETIVMMRVLDPLFTPEVEERFRKIFGVSVGRGLDILANRLGFMSFKVDKQTVVGNTVEVLRADVSMDNGKEYTLDVIREKMRVFIEERIKYYQKNMDMFLSQYRAALAIHEKTLKTKTQLHDYETYTRYAKMFNKGMDPKFASAESMYCNRYEKTEIIPNLPSEMKEEFRNAKSVYKYFYLKVQGEALGRILGRERTQCNIDMVRNMHTLKLSNGETTSLFEFIDNSEKKTILFTSFVEVVDEAAAYLSENGYQPLKVYGATNKDLASIVASFEKNKDFNPLIATFQSLSTAVPLVMANSVGMLNSPFRPHEYEQALSRIDRIGQTEVVHCLNFFLDTGKEQNISTRSSDILLLARDMVSEILGVEVSDVATMESLTEKSSQVTLEELEIILDEDSTLNNLKPAWLSW